MHVITLKRCPFCGGEARIRTEQVSYWDQSCFDSDEYSNENEIKIAYYAECIKCYSRTGSRRTAEDAEKTWNRRESNSGFLTDCEALYKQERNIKTKIDNLHVGEIVYTKSSICVLDIGLVESINPFSVYARCNVYCENDKLYYGSPEKCNWYGTGIYKTYEEWENLTIDGKETKTICNILGIPYYMRKVRL